MSSTSMRLANARPAVPPPSTSQSATRGMGADRCTSFSRLDLRNTHKAELCAARFTSGLRTPPDEMGTTFQNPPSRAYYEQHALPSSCDPNARVDRMPVFFDAYSRPRPAQPTQEPMASCRRPTSSNTIPPTRCSPSPSSASNKSISMDSGNSGCGLSERDSAMVLHSLQIPACIDVRGGNLADFAASMTALFWFESISVLEVAERSPSTGLVRPLNQNAIACSHFKKWVQSVLSTTQVTQNVLLLALLFVYRLKVLNPTVHGRPGSEYRLLTVALMLGNKFLDDNTYTNKTWADVSGITVTEIHVMEVEFLSNMRYSLLASKDQWEGWLRKLARFWDYIDRASRRPPSPSPLQVPSPTHRLVSPAHSPTSTGPVMHATPMQHTPQSATGTPFSSLFPTPVNQPWPAPQMNPHVSSPLALRPANPGSRKRVYPEDESVESPAKRLSVGRQSYSSVLPPVQPQLPQPVPQRLAIPQPHKLEANPRPVVPRQQAHQPHRLSVPNLTVNTSQQTASAPFSAPAYATQQPLSLPPLASGVRAMSTVYAPATTYQSQLSILAPSGHAVPMRPVGTPTSAFPPMTYGTPAKRLSPPNAFTPVANYGASSPTTEGFPSHLARGGTASGVHTPISHSPSIYLQQRPSPYKPVRNVNTLLHPPPSAFLQQYHLPNPVPPNSMHYQPLGRRNELRTGVVPEYMLYSQQYVGPSQVPNQLPPHLLRNQDNTKPPQLPFTQGPSRQMPQYSDSTMNHGY